MTMLKDITYDLIELIAEDSKTLARIDTYVKDSAGCKPCKDIWKKIQDNREQEMSMLMSQLKQHIESESARAA
jgi:hypothetical protein